MFDRMIEGALVGVALYAIAGAVDVLNSLLNVVPPWWFEVAR